MSTTETEGQTNESGAAEESRAQNGSSKGKKALKVGALAAAAGTAAFAASKAMTSKGEEGKEAAKSENGASKGRASMDQIVSAVGGARWDVLKDLVMPFAENGARSAGSFVAKEGPDILSESLIPKFIDGFNEAQGQGS